MNLRRARTVTANSLEGHNAADVHLRGRRLVLAQVALGVLAVFALLVFVASFPVYYMQLQVICRSSSCAVGQLTPVSVQTLHSLGVSNESYVLFRIINTIVPALIGFAVAGMLVWRRSNEWIALLVALMLVLTGVAGVTNTVAGSASIWHFPARLLSSLSYPVYFLVFMIFPNGRFVPRWTRWLFITYLGVSVVYIFSPGIFNGNFWFNLSGALLFAGLISSLLAIQFYRYWRVSTPVQRQQTKWVVFGFAVELALGLVSFFLTLLVPSLNQPGSLYQLLFNIDTGISPLNFLLPLCFGIAILRYRLWDIDVLINRTLVYGTLTAILALVYFGLVVGLQFLFRELTSQVASSPLIIVGSTLAIAALFQPLRRRIQSAIDRRFYRRKYDAAKTLAHFSAILRDEVDLNQLSEQLVEVVEETMQPAHVSLWLRKPKKE
ncbi:MAG: hypothetical protein E6J48_09800 [Chloroflexi bacterium]|nr:MAG: hypothetical protein E6J48_09800 [Chloroflexota bacterium]